MKLSFGSSKSGHTDQFRQMVDDMPVSVMTCDLKDFRINYVNQSSKTALKQIEHALQTAEAIRAADLLAEDHSLRLPWPIDSRLDIVDVLNLDHPIAQRALAEAREIHRSAALSIEDPRLRRLYLERLPASQMLTRLAGSRPAGAVPS